MGYLDMCQPYHRPRMRDCVTSIDMSEVDTFVRICNAYKTITIVAFCILSNFNSS
jgi:hypothetical protein